MYSNNHYARKGKDRMLHGGLCKLRRLFKLAFELEMFHRCSCLVAGMHGLSLVCGLLC